MRIEKGIINLVASSVAGFLLGATSFMDVSTFLCQFLTKMGPLLERWQDSQILSLNYHNEFYLIISEEDTNYENRSSTAKIYFYLCLFVCLEVLIGSMIFPFLANRFGRRCCLIIINFLLILSSVFSLFFGNIIYCEIFIFKGALIVLLTYTSEISIPAIRGIMMSLPIAATFLGFCYNFYTPYEAPLLSLLFPIISGIIFSFCYETPHFYLMKKKVDKAERSLRAFRITENGIAEELSKMNSILAQQYEKSFCQLLKLIITKQLILTALFLFLTINAIFIVFMWMYELSKKCSCLYYNLYSAHIIILVLLSYILLPIITHFYGRKFLLFVLIVAMSVLKIIWSVLFLSGGFFMPWLTLLDVTLFLTCYNLATGIIVVMIVEMIPTRIKTWAISFVIILGYALAIVFIFLYLLCGFIYYSIPIVGVLLEFGLWAIALYLIIKYRYSITETKGKSLEDIYNELNTDNK